MELLPHFCLTPGRKGKFLKKMFNFDLLFLKNASFPIIIIKKCFKIVKKSKKMHMYFFHFLPSISLKWNYFLIFAWLSKKKGNLNKKLFNFNLLFLKNASFPIIIIIKCFKIVKISSAIWFWHQFSCWQ